jgi:murein DD-endopeptidase MepM/ murein hydrolase activator NlpD
MNVKAEDAIRNRFWYAWRFKQCPFDVPIAITEWGVDQKLNAPAGTPSEGWLGNLTPQAYAEQLREYIVSAAEDRRFLGATMFTHDYASDEWATYDSARALMDIVQTAQSLPEARWYEPGAMPPPVTLPTPPTEPSQPSQKHAYRLPLDAIAVTQWWSRQHGGIDYSCVVGTPVRASADGVVAMVADDRDTKAVKGGYGLYVRIWHEQLRIHTFYAHLSRQDVKDGDRVKYGQTIGVSGSTGNSTGPHLHYEVRLGTGTHTYDKDAAGDTYNARIDPMAWKHGHEHA